jgi:hypothetical protein
MYGWRVVIGLIVRVVPEPELIVGIFPVPRASEKVKRGGHFFFFDF